MYIYLSISIYIYIRHTVSKLIGSPPGYVGYDEEIGGYIYIYIEREREIDR